MANHDNYIIKGSSLDAIAAEVKTLSDTSDKMTVSQITSNIAQANAGVAAQADIIGQIQTALESKTASGGGNTEEIENIIDASGVLESTDGTAMEKVEQLIDELKNYNFYQENLRTFSFSGNKNITEIPPIDCVNITSLNNAFCGCNNRNFKVISLKNTHNISDYRNFIYDTYVETVGVLDFSKADKTGINAFIGNTSIINLEIVPSTVHFSISIPFSKLTAESKDSVFNGLATVETAQTLTLPANLKILQSQVNNANVKGWTVAGGTVVSEEEYYG